MKIMCLYGSPRAYGNSAILTKTFCDTAERLGATVKYYFLHSLTYSGCTGCETCKAKLERCVIEDDLSEILEAVYEIDILVPASPVYYGDISSQLKAFIDRTFSYLVPDYVMNPVHSRLLPNKKLVFVLTQSNADETHYADIFPRYEHFFNWYYGFQDNHLIRACGVSDPGDVEALKDVKKHAELIAQRLMT